MGPIFATQAHRLEYDKCKMYHVWFGNDMRSEYFQAYDRSFDTAFGSAIGVRQINWR